jgi:hypothetical protein
MGSITLRDKSGKWVGHLAIADIYKFEGYLFEMRSYMGPCRLKKDGDPYDRIIGPKSKFWDMFERWGALTEEEKENTRWYCYNNLIISPQSFQVGSY